MAHPTLHLCQSFTLLQICKGVLSILHVAGLQDDLLYESLTVYETLYYAAMLRLPQHMDHAAKTERVETVITALGLSSCKDTIIGMRSMRFATYIKACLVLCAQWLVMHRLFI